MFRPVGLLPYSLSLWLHLRLSAHAPAKAGAYIRRLLSTRRADCLKVVLDKTLVFPRNLILIESVLLRGSQIRVDVSIIQFGTFLLACLFQFLRGAAVVLTVDLFHFEFDIELGGSAQDVHR